MALKPIYKRWIIWTLVGIAGLFAIGVVVVPPMINLNNLKPKLQSAIYQQTGIDATIAGDIHFSLLGHATIVAHNVTTTYGKINNVAFRVPLAGVFDVENAPLTGDISVHGGKLHIDTLAALPLNHDVEIYDTSFMFLDKEYTVVRGKLSDGELSGTIRTNQHKYDINFSDNEFYIRNQNDNLEIYGQLFDDGSAAGRMAIDTDNLNRWFEFSEPKINQRVRMTANFNWDGEYGFVFSNIYANDTVHGQIELMPDGARKIALAAQELHFDFSFLKQPSTLFSNTEYNLDFYGDLQFGKYTFGHVLIQASGTPDALKIHKIIADDISFTGGYIDKSGAHDIAIQIPYEGIPATCMFSGTPDKWSCKNFVWDAYRGNISTDKNTFDVAIISANNMPQYDVLMDHIKKLGAQGKIKFTFADMGGTLDITRDGVIPQYEFAHNKTMDWLNPNFKFLPEFMTHDIGNFTWRGDTMDFMPDSGRWFLSLSNNRFYMSGTNIKDLFPNMDLQSVNDNLEYTISGIYSKNNISDLKITIADHTFTGTMTGGALQLTTKLLNLDAFINQNFIDNYAELQFFANAPIMIPFDIKSNVFLSADRIIYNGDEYQNFIYSLKPNVQALSITDRNRGNMLAIIEKNKSQYDISVQLNKFVTTGPILSQQMPLNINDATITADISLATSGHIAHDLEYNLSGTMDIIVDGGYISGIGIDQFYASAENITTLNAEDALITALTDGKTKIKTAHIVGEYSNGDFITTAPLTLQMRHADATGGLAIQNGLMNATFDITMRGTAPTPVTVQLDIAPDGSRGYSLSEIMQHFDAAFMRAFIKIHNKF